MSLRALMVVGLAFLGLTVGCDEAPAPANPNPDNQNPAADAETQRIYDAWSFGPQDAARYQALEMGGMNQTPDDRINRPFWLGPTGIIARMDRGAMRYEVEEVASGSPADGKLVAGDLIVGAYGEPFRLPVEDPPLPAHLGPNPHFGNAILEAWAKHDGVLKLEVTTGGNARTIELHLPGAGEFSDSFPERDPMANAWIRMDSELLLTRQHTTGAGTRVDPATPVARSCRRVGVGSR